MALKSLKRYTVMECYGIIIYIKIGDGKELAYEFKAWN